jgi:hypothetical protein
MGKRPTNATKGGKFMNPTDQARLDHRCVLLSFGSVADP